MAIVASNLYSGRVITGDTGYPSGKAQDIVNGEKGTGTPLRASWVNDQWGFLQALLDAANITPSGTPDQVGQSDYLDAVNKLIREPLALKIFQSPSSEGLTEIQTRTVDSNEVYEVRKTSDDTFATIYSDAAGTTEIVQNGTDNKSDSDGVIEFFVADGDYYVEVGGVKSNFEVGDAELQNLIGDTSRFTNSNTAIKNLYAPMLYSRFKKARAKCSAGRAYVWRNQNRLPDSSYKFSLGINQGGFNTAEWDFIEDADGFIRMRYGYTGAIRESDIFIDAENLSTPPSSTSGDNAWFDSDTKLNATFEINFTGTGLLFNHSVDSRGGMFSVSVDGGDSIVISTNSNNPENSGAVGASMSKLVVSSLEDTSHTAVFTFIGDDPLYPSTDPLRSKGFFKLSNGVEPEAYTTTVITNEQMGIGQTGNKLVSNGILEFAIRAARSGSGLEPDWCPAHGSSTGSIRVNDLKIYIDSDIQPSNFPDVMSEREVKEFTMVQEYEAFNSNETDFDNPMWRGVLTTKFDRINGLSYHHDLIVVNDIDVTAGYTGMVSGRRTEGLDLLELDNGYEIDITSATPPEQVSHNTGLSSSVCYEGDSNILAMEAIASSSLMLGRNGDTTQEVLVTERIDGFVKSYMNFAVDYQLKNGDKISSNHKIWLGVK